MPVHRKRFRIEEAFGTEMPSVPEAVGGDIGPMHREIMAELRAIRVQKGTSGHKGGNGPMGESGKSATAAAREEKALGEDAEARPLPDSHPAQTAQGQN